MFSLNQINTFLHLAQNGINKRKPNDLVPDKVFRDILGAKVLIDQWGEITTHWIVPLSHQQKIRYELQSLIGNIGRQGEGDKLWGAAVIYSEHLTENVGLGVSLDARLLTLSHHENLLLLSPDDISRQVALFPLEAV